MMVSNVSVPVPKILCQWKYNLSSPGRVSVFVAPWHYDSDIPLDSVLQLP